MKVLRIYDHLGELKKEFNVYVEGEDFKWESSYPEPIWLGTISLEEAGKEPEAEPTPEAGVEESILPQLSPEQEQEIVELREEAEAEAVEIVKEAEANHKAVVEAVVSAELSDIEEVKSEPKKLRAKGNRDKRAKPSSGS